MIKLNPLKLLIILLAIFPYHAYSTSTNMSDAISIKQFKGKDAHGRYSIQYPNFKEPYLAKRLNNFLKKVSIDTFLCEKDESKQGKMYSNIVVKPSFLSKSLLSYSLQYDSYCGGPYPDNGVLYVIVDINKGKLIDMKTQFKDFKTFKQLLYNEFQKQQPKHYIKDCQHLITPKELSLLTPDYLLKDKTLIVRQSYAHVARACEYNITIPCSLLKSNLKQNSSLSEYCS